MNTLQIEALRSTEQAITAAICAAGSHAHRDEYGCWRGLTEVDWALGLIVRDVPPQPKRKCCPGLKVWRFRQDQLQIALMFVDVVECWYLYGRSYKALLPERCPGQ